MVSVAGRATGPDRGGPGGLRSTRERAGRLESATVNLFACPECGLPAEATERFSLSSTDGLVEHVALACVDGHYFRMPADRLSPEARPLAAGSGAAVDARRAASAANSRIGYSRLPGTLGTVANADSGPQDY